MIIRSTTRVLTEDINNKIGIGIEKSLLDKIKLNDDLKACRHCSKYNWVSKNLFDVFYLFDAIT